MYGTDLRTFWCRTVEIGQGVSTGWAKKFEKIRIFHHFETLRPYISDTVKNRGNKQCMQKSFIPPLSNCHICMDQSLTGFYRVGQKLSDVIPVLRITPRATEPSTVSVFLSSVKCGFICRAQTCAHSGIEPSTLATGFQRMGQKFEKNSNFGPFLAFTSPMSQ